jgi:hypothetical protein
LGEEDNPKSLMTTEIIPVSEFKKGLTTFKYDYSEYDDAVYHLVGAFKNNVSVSPIEKKWIDELKLIGYDVNQLTYTLKEKGVL